MNLKDIYLRSFRNYGELQIVFDPGVNLIVGDNAQGKTNLLEGISYLGCGKSFRAQKTAEMIRFGDEFAELSGNVTSQQRDQSLRWLLFKGSRPRQIYRNGAKKKTAGEIAGVLPTVLFCPEDLMVLKTGAAQRRRMGDYVLCQLRPILHEHVQSSVRVHYSYLLYIEDGLRYGDRGHPLLRSKFPQDDGTLYLLRYSHCYLLVDTQSVRHTRLQ